MTPILSIVIPVYRNEGSIPELLSELGGVCAEVRRRYGRESEVVLVVDGSPDGSAGLLRGMLPGVGFASRLALHSRNFGSFQAIRTGLGLARGDYSAVIAADLQEPPELVLRFLEAMVGGGSEVVVGCRETRDDPWASRLASETFWRLYRWLVNREVSEKGVDVFGCTRGFRERLLEFPECNTSLIGQIYWLGFRRAEVTYQRLRRRHGKSGWTLRKKVDYLLDSVFAFTDLPVRLLGFFGLLGTAMSLLLGAVVFTAKVVGNVPVPGYAATVLTVIFFGGLNSLGLSVVGAYAWRAYENTKRRPLSVVAETCDFVAGSAPGPARPESP